MVSLEVEDEMVPLRMGEVLPQVNFLTLGGPQGQ